MNSKELEVRERLNPQPGDYYYLHLKDLLKALGRHKTEDAITILDYGCGNSPYRPLFPNSEYRRADIDSFGNSDLDYAINQDGSIPEEDDTFDLILSTQVLEHVPDPKHYLAECYRLLRPNGRLICTTHGSFPDHACPSDFYRWTADGLALEMKRVGFTLEEVTKLTTGTRAFFSMLELSSKSINRASKSFFGFTLIASRKIYWHTKFFFHKKLDKHFENESVVDGSAQEFDIYLGLMIVGKK